MKAKKNPQDTTLRNLRKTRREIQNLYDGYTELATRIGKLERAWSSRFPSIVKK